MTIDKQSLVEKIATRARKDGSLYYKVAIIAILPALAIAYIHYRLNIESLTSTLLERRLAMAKVSSATIQEKFDGLVTLGQTLAIQDSVVKSVEAGRWKEAAASLANIPRVFPYIELISLLDTDGTNKGETPMTLGALGKNFSFRQYYKDFMASKKPYISNVFRRTSQPQYNIIVVLVPINDSNGRFIGILMLQLRLNTLLTWSGSLTSTPDTYAYFVDREGNIAGHSKYGDTGNIINFKGNLPVDKVLTGETGVVNFLDPNDNEQDIAGYSPIGSYGWGIVLVQRADEAYKELWADLVKDMLMVLSIVAIVIIMTYLILDFIRELILLQYRQETFLNSIGDAVVAIDRSWNVVLFNKAAEELTGYDKDEVVGRPLRSFVKFIREDTGKEDIGFIEETMLFNKAGEMEDGTQLVRKDGSRVNITDSASPIPGQDNQSSGAIIIFRDNSPHIELEKMRNEFNSLTTHQLRTPITSIIGYLELLLDKKNGKLSKLQREFVDSINSSSAKLLDLVNAMLNVSRIESGRLAVNPEPANLADISNKIIESLQPEIKNKKIDFIKEYSQENTPIINLDQKLAGAIIQNLLSNAIKYTPENGHVTLSISQDEKMLIAKVKDTGYGIPPDDQSKIFGKMFRAKNIQEVDPTGTGLGLYIVKSIIDQTGGKISFESEEGRGTTFVVQFPLNGMQYKTGIKGLV